MKKLLNLLLGSCILAFSYGCYVHHVAATYDGGHSIRSKSTLSRAKFSSHAKMKMASHSRKSKSHKSSSNSSYKAGTLTAGELNDFSKWELWKDIDATNLKGFRESWKFSPKERYIVQLTNAYNGPAIDLLVELKNKEGETLWSSRTDNTGKAELWSNMFNSGEKPNTITIHGVDGPQEIQDITPFRQGINTFQLQNSCSDIKAVDLAFVVDATGSMGDEIRYLKTELDDVINKAKKQHANLNLRLGTVFYRDRTDAYLTRSKDFSKTLLPITSFIARQGPGGGGDYPEAVDAGLEEAVNKLSWRKEARTRLLFLILDAPPHSDSTSILRMQNVTRRAAEKGIRIIPITASGINKSTEYLMRSLALATNGTYVFLTDDSGVGGSHIKPTTDSYNVELLNDLLLRLIRQYASATCRPDPQAFSSLDLEETHDSIAIFHSPEQDEALEASANLEPEKPRLLGNILGNPCNHPQLTVYPNPTLGALNISSNCENGEVFLADMNGKLLIRYKLSPTRESGTEMNIRDFPSGLYILRYHVNEAWYTEKIVKLN